MRNISKISNPMVEVLRIYIIIFGLIWSIFFINNIVLHEQLTMAITPRTMSWSQFFSLFMSCFYHVNMGHIINNSITLFLILWIIVVLEKRPYLTLILLIFISGLFTWLFGSNGTAHVGASGLIYAIFGFTFARAIDTRKFVYFSVSLVLLYYFYSSLILGLVPKQEISFSAHLGGLIAGVIVACMFKEKSKLSNSRTKTSFFTKSNNFLK